MKAENNADYSGTDLNAPRINSKLVTLILPKKQGYIHKVRIAHIEMG